VVLTTLARETHRPRAAMRSAAADRLISKGASTGSRWAPPARPKREEQAMFASTEAFSGFAVDDMEAARAFYEQTLGLRTSSENGLMTLHLAGNRPTLVYPKPDHVPAAYTILNFRVDDIDSAVDELTARGVRPERYDGFEQDERGIFRGGGPYIAWFKDPAGNVLAVLQERDA
jgi:catechol 2,3-dioxygenase-like lactoylglutathione lyase family enzyme